MPWTHKNTSHNLNRLPNLISSFQLLSWHAWPKINASRRTILSLNPKLLLHSRERGNTLCKDSLGMIFPHSLLRTAQSGVNARQNEALSQITHACQCFLHLAPTGTRAKNPEIFARVPTPSVNGAFCAP